MKRIYNYKKTISMKQFIAEFGENFSENMKAKLMELEIRCVLTRKEDMNKFDLKHVEHLLYDFESTSEEGVTTHKKEYVYGQLLVVDGILYFSKSCTENDKTIASPIVGTIFENLKDEDSIQDADNYAKKIDDSNINYVIDTILTVCPQVSQEYIKIMKDIFSRTK